MIRRLLLLSFVFTFVCGKNVKTLEKVENNQVKNSQNQLKVEENHPRLFKIKPITIITMLIGGLVKLAALIPIILVVAVIVGLVSLVGSKIALLISLVLGIKTLLSLLPSKSSDSSHEEELSDIKEFAMKMAMQTAFPKKQIYYSFPQYMKQPNDPYYYYENYFMPKQLPIPIDNQMVNENAIDETVNVAAAHAVQQQQQNVANYYANANGNDDRLRLLAAAEMAAKANSILNGQSAENPNRRIGVKITKTVLKRSE